MYIPNIKVCWLVVLFLLLTAGCRQLGGSELPTAAPLEAAAVSSQAASTAAPKPTEAAPAPTETATSTKAAPPTAAAPSPTPTQPAEFVWPSPAPALPAFNSKPPSAEEQEVFELLQESRAAAKDPYALAKGYDRLYTAPDPVPEAAVTPPEIGSRQTLTISNIDTNVNVRIEAILLAIGEHAYFWFDTSPGLTKPTDAQLVSAAAAFDEIYDKTIAYFGQENRPGIDNDPRIHIVNASPISICDVTEENLDRCGLLGYVSSRDTLPAAVNQYSNEREMFIMNGRIFGSSRYVDVLAHEFRHMIEANYDNNDIDWEVEGSAMLAEDLLGFSADPVARANWFLSNPDQQLNRWTDGNTMPYYGQGYLFNRYIFNRLGPELYREFATDPANGLAAIDDVAERYQLPFDGYSLWLEWLVALAIHNEPNAPENTFLGPGIDTAAMTRLDSSPKSTAAAVSQFGADYYQLSASDEATVTFTGSSLVPLLKVLPASGERMWMAQRANYSSMRLTRSFDLSDVASATLNYLVFHEIEKGYDFAYVSVSTDGGELWQPLTAANMQGASAADDPGESALGNRFYTGSSDSWLAEQIDLSPFAGQEIQLRFEYITDPILTFSGMALDNISIPEIGFYDGAESAQGWQEEGFIRATGYVPQRWSVQLISFENGYPELIGLSLDDNGTASVELRANSHDQEPILIVAAATPFTLEAGHYEIVFE